MSRQLAGCARCRGLRLWQREALLRVSCGSYGLYVRSIRRKAVPSGPGEAVPQKPNPQQPGISTAAADNNAFPPIPWDVHKVFQVMLLWLVAFFLAGAHTSAIVPSVLGTDAAHLSTAGAAVGYLFCDVANLVLTFAIITRAVRPHDFWRAGIFTPIRIDAALAAHVAAAAATFPLVDAVSAASVGLWSAPPDALSAHLEQSLSAGDILANIVYLSVVSCCTPLWEEVIFRAFLLSSLTRYMRPAAATAVAAAAFAAAHFSVQRSPYLLLLGLIIGHAFVRTRNLAAPVLIHALWNFYVFVKVAIFPYVFPSLAALVSWLGHLVW